MSAPGAWASEYSHLRRLSTGEWVGVQRFLFTWGLMVGLDERGYRTRFCYEHPQDAVWAAQHWDGSGDPPGPWVKEKGRGGERSNPCLDKRLMR